MIDTLVVMMDRDGGVRRFDSTEWFKLVNSGFIKFIRYKALSLKGLKNNFRVF